jgi:hypothetical protein
MLNLKDLKQIAANKAELLVKSAKVRELSARGQICKTCAEKILAENAYYYQYAEDLRLATLN